MSVQAYFRSVCDPVTELIPIEVRGLGSNGQLFMATEYLGYYGLDISATSSVRLTASRVDFFNLLYIRWMYRVPGRTEFILAGTSTNQVYVSWRVPTTANLYHTVVGVACGNAKGRTQESNIVAGIWNYFTDRDVQLWDCTRADAVLGAESACPRAFPHGRFGS